MSRYWKEQIEIFESYDFDSLCEEALPLFRYIERHLLENSNFGDDSWFGAMMVGCYFVDSDRFVDGAEESLFMSMFKRYHHDFSASNFMREYKRYEMQNWVENYIYNSHGELRNVILALGCIICASDGFITESERERILKWA